MTSFIFALWKLWIDKLNFQKIRQTFFCEIFITLPGSWIPCCQLLNKKSCYWLARATRWHRRHIADVICGGLTLLERDKNRSLNMFRPSIFLIFLSLFYFTIQSDQKIWKLNKRTRLAKQKLNRQRLWFSQNKLMSTVHWHSIYLKNFKYQI